MINICAIKNWDTGQNKSGETIVLPNPKNKTQK
jgi:hypothetical protein